METVQVRYLKRIIEAPLSTPNYFVFLEFAKLPATYVIHTRQLTFLHHICNLEETDPVRRLYEAMKLLPYEKNWANEISLLLDTYGLENHQIIKMSKEAWKKIVKKNVTKVAFASLVEVAKNKSKTRSTIQHIHPSSLFT